MAIHCAVEFETHLGSSQFVEAGGAVPDAGTTGTNPENPIDHFALGPGRPNGNFCGFVKSLSSITEATVVPC